MVLGTRGGFFLAHRSRGFRRDQPIIIIKRDFDRNWKLCALEKPLQHRADREEKKKKKSRSLNTGMRQAMGATNSVWLRDQHVPGTIFLE